MKLINSILFASVSLTAACVDSDEVTITAADLGAEELQLDHMPSTRYVFSPSDGALDLSRISLGHIELEKILQPAIQGSLLTGRRALVDCAENGYEVSFEIYVPDGAAARGATSTGGQSGTCTHWQQHEVFNSDSGMMDTVSICMEY